MDEMLLGYDGAFVEFLTMRDGEVVSEIYGTTYLCQGNVWEQYDPPERYWDIEQHTYSKSVDGGYRDMIVSVKREGSQWYRSYDIYERDKTEISQDEAAAIMAKYPRIQLDWKPLMDYPLDESGLTLGSYLKAKDVQPSDDELLRIYKDCAQRAGFLLYPLPDHGHQRRWGKGSSAQRRR